MSVDGFTVIPVLLDFDQSKQIGELHVRKDAMPSEPNYVFALGYTLKHGDKTPKHEVLCVSLLPDENYARYLQQAGKLPAA